MASDNGREIGEKRRRDRLAASLRENLKRRKIQQRGRAIENPAAGPGPAEVRETQESLPGASGDPGA